MDLSDPPRKPRTESIVPMINVVFLLLIFFLMTSQITTPDPFEIDTPIASQDQEATADPVLYVDASGRLHFDGAEDDAAITALSSVSDTVETLMVKADANLSASILAATLARLTQVGFATVELVVAAP